MGKELRYLGDLDIFASLWIYFQLRIKTVLYLERVGVI